MGLFEELSVPGRFNRLRKYFKGLEMNDLDPNYHYSSLVADVDKLIMQVFCDKYICTPDHKFIRRVLNQDDIGEENLEETVTTFEILLKKRDEDLEQLRKDLDDEINSKNDLQYEHNMLVNKLCPNCRPEDKTQSTDSDSNSDDPTQVGQAIYNLGMRKMTKFKE